MPVFKWCWWEGITSQKPAFESVFCYLLSLLVKLPELFLDEQHCKINSLTVISYDLIYLYLGKLALTSLCTVMSNHLLILAWWKSPSTGLHHRGYVHCGSLANTMRRQKSLQKAVQKKELLTGYTGNLDFASPNLHLSSFISIYI